MATSVTLLTGPWKIKRGALSPPYRLILRQADKQPIDLDGCVATFLMRLRGADDPTVENEMTILQEGDVLTGINIGMAEYQWQLGDTDVSGIYDVEVEVVDPGGNPIRVPNDSYLELQILGNLSAEPVSP
jgi:hypothetical protein